LGYSEQHSGWSSALQTDDSEKQVNERLHWEIGERDGLTLVSLRGQVNEDVDLEPLARALAGRRHVRLELRDIERINSCGVREWVYFMRLLPRACRIDLDECPPAVVSRLNMISNFAGHAQIASVRAPYICETCGHEQGVLVQVERGRRPCLERVSCVSCGGEMKFDDVEDSYFAFLS
jgi:hypothetical protein